MSAGSSSIGALNGRFIEIDYESRKINATFSGTEESFVFSMFIDYDQQVALAPNAEFLDASDDAAFLEYAYTILPNTRLLPTQSGDEVVLILDRVAIEKIGPIEWKCAASYKFDSNAGVGGARPDNPTPGTHFALEYIKMHFTIGGGSTTVTMSEGSDPQKASDSNLAGVPSNALAIGASKEGVAGIEIPNGFRLQITGYYFPWAVDLDFADDLAFLIHGPKHKGTYNDATFLGRPAGTMSLLAASGGGSVVDIIPITYEFDYKPNITNEPDGNFPNLTMLGQEVLEYRIEQKFDDDVGGTKDIISIPSIRIIHEVRSAEDYSVLRLPSV